MVESGSLGEIHAVQTTCMDQQDPTGEHFPESFVFNLWRAG